MVQGTKNKTEMKPVRRPRLVLHSNQQIPTTTTPSHTQFPLEDTSVFGGPVSCHRFVLCLWCLGQEQWGLAGLAGC